MRTLGNYQQGWRDTAQIQMHLLPTTQASKEDEYEIETVHPNYKDNTPNASQSEIIKSFETIARQTNQEDKILDFPFIDHGQPLK